MIRTWKIAALLGASCLLLLSPSAKAQEDASAIEQKPESSIWDKFHNDFRVTLQYISEDDTDLGATNAGTEDSFSQQLQMMTGVDLTEDWYGFFHGRALNINGESGFDDDTGATIATDQSFLELRELYVKKKNLFNVTPLSLQVGRQRFREPRALWWNSDQDAVRLAYNSTLLNSFVAVSENLASYRNNSDNDFRYDDEDRFRVLGETSWQYQYNHFLEGRLLYEDDHSGIEGPGSVVSVTNRDNEDQELVWAGVRLAGQFQNASDLASTVKYRADLMGVAGEEDQLVTAAGPSLDRRVVTGSSNRDVLGWGLDTGVIIDPLESGGVALTFGYAFGSGDDGTGGTDNAFRQTDMQGNSSRVGLERQQQKNYGEVLRPELSNLHILSAGAAYPLSDASDISLTYFNYTLDEEATLMRSSGISVPMTGTNKDVGQALDFVLNVNIDKQFDVKMPYTDSTDFRFVAGSFFPGDAYGPANDDNALRLFTELRFRF